MYVMFESNIATWKSIKTFNEMMKWLQQNNAELMDNL